MSPKRLRDLYVGLISGTSADAIDAVLVRFGARPELVAARALPYPPALRERVLALARADARVALDELGQLDVEVGRAFAAAVEDLLAWARADRASLMAIGSHGQTIRHGPAGDAPFTLQIGDPNVIAEISGVTTVADFRRRDMAAGGQGAPLLPALHAALFRSPETPRVVLNLGGIANITTLPADPAQPVRGFDTGPANCLLDAWAGRHLGQPRDDAGAWAATGTVDQDLLSLMLGDPYFAAPPPKSTGRELFNLDWLQRQLDAHVAIRGVEPPAAVDVQATLMALSVRSIADAILAHGADATEVLACGGGVHNDELMRLLGLALAPRAVKSTMALGVDPDYVEATAFAWLAKRRLEGLSGNLPSVTGAAGERVLGGVFLGA
jgi:anhydro-N-acetylmuramic acid kinase